MGTVLWTRSLTCPLCSTTGASVVNCRKLWRFRSCSSCCSWTRSLTCPLCSTKGASVVNEQKTVEVPQLQCSVVDVPASAVHRRLWPSVLMHRQCFLRAVLGQGGDMPVVVTTGHGVPQVLLWLWTSLRSCRDGVSRDVEMPQTSRRLRASSCATETGSALCTGLPFLAVMAAMKGGLSIFSHFSRSSGDVPESSASFRSPRAHSHL